MYLIAQEHWSPDDPGWTKAVAAAYARRDRPLCLCRTGGIEMYIARLGNDYLVKRMPYTGHRHAPDCLSYELPSERCDDQGASGSPIVEDPDTGFTTLRLGFPLLRCEGRSTYRGPPGPTDSVSVAGSTLSLGGLLRYLWKQAELTHWRPEFEGKRSWPTVRRRLLIAAASAIAKGEPLRDRLFVPEAFAVERREEISARRAALFCKALPGATGQRKLLLLCGEVKEISPSRHGCTALIKHVPDQPFALDERLYRRMEARFEQDLSLWGAASGCRMITLATFGMSPAGVPVIEQLTLMPVDAQWIPIRDAFELRLIEQLLHEHRRFIKVPPDIAEASGRSVSVVLTDVGDDPVPLRISSEVTGGPGDSESTVHPRNEEEWVWRIDSTAMPPLPARARTIPRPVPLRG